MVMNCKGCEKKRP